MVGSDWLILRAYFLAAYGTGSVGDHTSICNSAKATAYQLTRRGSAPSKDFERAEMILNFGCSVLESHTNHLPTAERWTDALARGAKLYTFDARLSNTAARSTEWVPIQPGTDLAVVLAMCHVLLDEGLYDETSLETHTNVTLKELLQHLDPYSPAWAERKSGVPATKIRLLAREFAASRPAFCISGRGAFMHHNGVETERALLMLEALAGQIDLSGLRRPARWNLPFPMPVDSAKRLNIFDGKEGAFAYPTAHVSHQILSMIDKGPERPEIYMVYCHNPVYSNGDCRDNEKILRDEEKIPFLISVDVGLSETSVLADLVLPDATYLERWSYVGRTSPEGEAEYSIRQPMHPPLGEARNFCDVACDIAKRLGLGLGFSSAEEFVRRACEVTPGVKDVGGFEYMKEHGIWCDSGLDDSEPAPKTTFFQIKSQALAAKGFSAIPGWMPVPEHENLSKSELILITFKVPTQSHSRTQNCKWLTELYHENPVWIHPETAADLDIGDGDAVALSSDVGEIVTKARLTEGIHPRAVAISNHCGHWAYGEYASGTKSFVHVSEPDGRLKWWKDSGVHPNWIIPNRGDPIAGALCWMDTVVRVQRGGKVRPG
jgi:anaerobic selenocysteine-containing dehydrogenase